MKVKNDRDIWKRIAKIYLKYKNYFAVLLICMIGSSFFLFLQPMVIQKITDVGMMNKNIFVIEKYTLFLFVIGISNYCFQLLMTNNLADLHNKLTFDLEQEILKKMYRIQFSFFKKYNATQICSMISSDISTIASFADRTFSFSITSILHMIAGIVGLFILNWKMTFIIITLLPIRYLIIRFLSKKKSLRFSEYLENTKICTGWLGDQIAGILEVKLWNLLKKKLNEYQELQQLVKKSYKSNVLLDYYNIFFERIMDIILNCILYVLSGYFIINNEFTIGKAFAFLTYSTYVITPMNLLMNIKYIYADMNPAAKRLFEVLDYDEEKTGNIRCDNIVENPSNILIKCENISFGYDSRTLVLENLNLVVHKGEKIGIIGENGTGKSTLLNLLLGCYTPQNGEIYFNGKKYSNLSIEDIRSKFAVVSQLIHIFQATIIENVDLIGKSKIEEVEVACIKSGANFFVEKYSEKYYHQVAVDGNDLSGGEKQKIALARAILKGAEIWILDESTNGLDTKSIDNWRETLQTDYANQTVIMVTHKIEELIDMDRILCLKNGKLEEIK